MKQVITNKPGKEQLQNQKQQETLDKNYLYNLLFSGRISLKEYLNKVKEKELQQQAA